MTATLIMKDTGSQFPVSPEHVENICRKYSVTRFTSSDAQVHAEFGHAEYPCAIIANRHSQAHAILAAAHLRDNPTNRTTRR